jgi:hypothetical protein
MSSADCKALQWSFRSYTLVIVRRRVAQKVHVWIQVAMVKQGKQATNAMIVNGFTAIRIRYVAMQFCC